VTDLDATVATQAASGRPPSGLPANDTGAIPTPVLDAARSYAERGWRIIPIKAGEKRPTFSDWTNVATTDPDRIARWYNGTNHGVGIVTGQASGIFVLDVDIADGKPGIDTLAALQVEHGHFPTTVKAKTGSGGLHYYFRWPTDGTVVVTNGGRLGPGLDVRGEGGQVVAAPTVHPNGERYAWWPNRGPADIDVADAPAWLLELLRPAEPTVPTLAPVVDYMFPDPITGAKDDSPAAHFNNTTTWDQLLTRDGWTLHQTLANGEQRWVRPGKEGRDGISATVGHQGRDCLKVFTSSVPELEADRPYSRFGYEAAMRHHGDRSALASTIRRDQMPRQHDDLTWAQAAATTNPLPELDPDTGQIIEPEPVDELAYAHIVDWPDFWSKDRAEQQWVIWPLVPVGRAVALYAPAKAGKSTILLAAVAAAVTGRAAFGGEPPEHPPTVLYMDYEMTEDDLEERLEELGYGPDDDLSRLRYALLPSIDPLDTHAGAQAIVDLATRFEADLVVIDTFGRAVEGEEDKADTVRAFYRHTGLALKTRGISVLRTDHSGKDVDKGQRGSSAKQDDVDVVWKLARAEGGAKLTRTHSRISWVPAEIELLRQEHDGVVSFRTVDGAGQSTYPAGTKALATILDNLEVPLAATRNDARAILQAAGHKTQNKTLGPALKYRRIEAERHERADMTAFETPKSGPQPVRTDQNGPNGPNQRTETDRPQNPRSDHADRPNGPGGPTNPATTDRVPPKRGTGNVARPDDDYTDIF
jgi:hypothetical protein